MREYFSIPNLLGYTRILLSFLYIYLFYKAIHGQGFMPAIIVLIVSGMTDFLDGRIARKYDMVTRWGKILDPIADKVSLGAIILSLSFVHREIIFLGVFYALKEMLMALAGIYSVRIGCEVEGAMWYGKICTFVTYIILFILLINPKMKSSFVYSFVATDFVLMAFSLYNYIIYFVKICEDRKLILDKRA